MIDGVSVIICCHNSVSRLSETLRHLSVQQHELSLNWEVIVVDNASTDSTSDYARQYWSATGNSVTMRVIAEPKPGLSFARNTGIVNAKYEIILLCDDDNWLNYDYVQFVYDQFTNNKSIGVLGGRNIGIAQNELPYWFSDYQHFYAVGCQQLYSGEMTSRDFVFGAGMAFRNSVYQELIKAGFRNLLTDRTGDSLMSGGDLEICYIHKIVGLKIWYDENLVLRHFMSAGRLNKSYVTRLQDGAMQSIKILQAYDPYMKPIPKSSVKKIGLFCYYLLRHFISKYVSRTNPKYFLTYIEAFNITPICFSEESARIRKVIANYLGPIRS
jgi:glycosyltransferase involved in cell wall biosynthesis